MKGKDTELERLGGGGGQVERDKETEQGSRAFGALIARTSARQASPCLLLCPHSEDFSLTLSDNLCVSLSPVLSPSVSVSLWPPLDSELRESHFRSLGSPLSPASQPLTGSVHICKIRE